MSTRPTVTGAVTAPSSRPDRPTAAPEPARRGGDARRPPTTLRPLLLRLHFYAGLFIAPFLLVAAVTGLAYTAMPQVERLVHADVLEVPAAPTSLPLSEQVQAARAAHPEGTISSVTPAPGPTDSTRVALAVEGLGDYTRTVFVNPHTGAVLGAERTYGQWLPVRAWFDDLHRNLHLGAVGRNYSELAASWLWVIALGGVWLWWGRRRMTRRSSRRPRTGRRRLLRVHTAVGVVAVLGLVGLSATGMTWSKHAGDNIAQLRDQLAWQTPSVDTGPVAAGGEHANHAGHGGAAAPGDMSGLEAERVTQLDRVAAAGADAGLRAPMDITLPTSGEGRFGLQENHRSWPERQDSMAVDGTTGAVTDTLRFDDWPLAAKLATWGIDAHMGLLFGLPNQIVLAAIAIALIVLIVLGYRMWFARRPTRKRTPGGKPFPRGGWRHASKPALVAVGVGTLLVAWFVPLLGLSLLAFATIDAVIGAAKARRRVRAA